MGDTDTFNNTVWAAYQNSMGETYREALRNAVAVTKMSKVKEVRTKENALDELFGETTITGKKVTTVWIDDPWNIG